MQKMIARLNASILGLIVLGLIVVAIIGSKEAFVSGGTLVQLQTSHVPTAEELKECRTGLYGCVYRWIPFGF